MIGQAWPNPRTGQIKRSAFWGRCSRSAPSAVTTPGRKVMQFRAVCRQATPERLNHVLDLSLERWVGQGDELFVEPEANHPVRCRKDCASKEMALVGRKSRAEA